MNKRTASTISVLALVVVAVLVGVGLRGDDQAALEAATGPEHAAGMIATIDPETGELTTKAVDGAGLETSSEGLEEEALPGGGYKVDLEGRFQNRATVTVSDSDSVTIECEPGSADHREEK